MHSDRVYTERQFFRAMSSVEWKSKSTVWQDPETNVTWRCQALWLTDDRIVEKWTSLDDPEVKWLQWGKVYGLVRDIAFETWKLHGVYIDNQTNTINECWLLVVSVPRDPFLDPSQLGVPAQVSAPAQVEPSTHAQAPAVVHAPAPVYAPEEVCGLRIAP